jgi:hypothetical protein
MRAVDVEIDGAVGAVRGDGEEQRPAGDTEPVGERGWRHGLSLETGAYVLLINVYISEQAHPKDLPQGGSSRQMSKKEADFPGPRHT